jgi:hypothetical protein
MAGAALSALPDFLAAATFLITWIAPTTFGEKMVSHLVLVMLLEFLVVHSAGFMGVIVYGDGSRAHKLGMVGGLTFFYLLFAAAFGFSFGTWWPVQALIVLTLNRCSPLLLGPLPERDQMMSVTAGWAVGVVCYLFGAFATIMPPVPPLGITPEVVAAQGFTSTGLWIDEPWRPIAFGVVYFALQGLWELASGLFLARRTRIR